MIRYALPWTVGLFTPLFLPSLPPVSVLSGLLVLALALSFSKFWRPLALFLFALALGLNHAHSLHSKLLQTELEQVAFTVSGWVSNLPEVDEERLRFRFSATEYSFINVSEQVAESLPSAESLLLSWYQPPEIALERMRPGEYLTLEVRLKRPRGFANPGLFDYQKWLLTEGIHATGYVRGFSQSSKPEPSTAHPLGFSLDRWRMELGDDLVAEFGEESGALLAALAVGDRRHISNDQWQKFADTGVIHLMAISGLHIGIAAGFGILFGTVVARLGVLFGRNWNSIRSGALFGIFWALLYALAAGFTLPTQRALVMVVIYLSAKWFYLRLSPWDLLFLAMAVTATIDPLAILTNGFWLSFGAVAVLLFYFSGRQRDGYAISLVKAQLALLFGYSTILTLTTGRFSLLYPMINLLAVPLATLLIVPFALVGMAAWYWAKPLAVVFLSLAGWGASLLQSLTDSAHAVEFPAIGLLENSHWVAVTAIVGGFMLLLPAKFPFRRLGWLMLLPLFVGGSRTVSGVELTVLDVGQGSAAVLQTPNHTLVYDTGPYFSESFDAGADIVAAFLRGKGISEIDRLVVSHDDLDHAGGAIGLLKEVSANHVDVGMPISAVLQTQNLCADFRSDAAPARNSWNWDGVSFRYLYPETAISESSSRSDNDRSCVLLISFAGHSILLPGDISLAAEFQLLTHPDLPADLSLLIVPHHGSKSSSSWPFLRRVNAQTAVVSSGYKNSFGHPHPDIVQRYQQLDSELISTAESGAVTISWQADGVGGFLDPEIVTVRGNYNFWWQH